MGRKHEKQYRLEKKMSSYQIKGRRTAADIDTSGPFPVLKEKKDVDFTAIWNEAYNIYTDGARTEGARFNDMQAYLKAQVSAGNLTEADMFTMAADVMRTVDL